MSEAGGTQALRRWLLLAGLLLWLWGVSVFTPWAESAESQIRLYDTFFYLRFVLGGWALLECALLLRDWRRRPGASAGAAALALGALLLVGAWLYAHAGIGQRIRMQLSAAALADAANGPDSTRRWRAGHFIVDSRRHPCDQATPWLWLGRPFGAGSGTNLALAASGEQPPQAPGADAYRSWRAGNGWWMVYQHAARYHARPDRDRLPCMPVAAVAGHREGMAFIEAGRQALAKTR